MSTKPVRILKDINNITSDLGLTESRVVLEISDSYDYHSGSSKTQVTATVEGLNASATGPRLTDVLEELLGEVKQNVKDAAGTVDDSDDEDY